MGNKIAKVVIEFNYDLDSFRFMVGEEIPEEEFVQAVKDYVLEDLMDLMRTEDLAHWAEITVEDVNE